VFVTEICDRKCLASHLDLDGAIFGRWGNDEYKELNFSSILHNFANFN
jgi:hypothetical protein